MEPEEGNKYPSTGGKESSKQDEPKQTHIKINPNENGKN